MTACEKPAEPAKTAETVSLQPEGWAAKTLPEIIAALNAGEITSEALTQSYIDRIELIDRSGPTLQAVLAVNPDALTQAKALDARRAAGEDIGPLAGAPILLKDNIETADHMPTTAGALALAENYAANDAPLAAAIRANGGIILGKTNLSQWANFRSNESISGWSALGGQVRNPHMLDRTPCGSSSGSGAATAASLAAASVGTETNGSIICPANVNGVVGFKPTVGLVAQTGIVPISSSQDTAGPMTKSVSGAAILLSAMATGEGKADFVAGLDTGSLVGKRVGVLRFTEGENDNIKDRFNTALKVLEAEGAELVEITTFESAVDDFWGKSLKVLTHEFKTTLNAYLAATPEAVKTRTLKDLIAFNEAHGDIELSLFDQDIFESAEATNGIEDADYQAAVTDVQRATRVDGIDRLLREYRVDVLVSPSGPLAPRVDPVNGDVWPAWAGAGWMAAIAGYPHLSVPMGDVHGVPLGLSFIGTAGQDGQILSFGYAYEQASQLIVTPQYLSSAEGRPEIAAAMARKSY